jgi:hypothetical protein
LSGLAEEPEIDLGLARIGASAHAVSGSAARHPPHAGRFISSNPRLLKIIMRENSRFAGELSAAGLKYRRAIIDKIRALNRHLILSRNK